MSFQTTAEKPHGRCRHDVVRQFVLDMGCTLARLHLLPLRATIGSKRFCRDFSFDFSSSKSANFVKNFATNPEFCQFSPSENEALSAAY